VPRLKKVSWIWISLAYLVLTVVGAIIFILLFPGVHIRWYLLAQMTLLTFGLVIGINTQHWSKSLFWTIISSFAVLHLLGYVTLLSRVEKWPSSLFVAGFFIEVVAMNVGVAFLLSEASPTAKL
jgi:hypothetical protein